MEFDRARFLVHAAAIAAVATACSNDPGGDDSAGQTTATEATTAMPGSTGSTVPTSGSGTVDGGNTGTGTDDGDEMSTSSSSTTASETGVVGCDDSIGMPVDCTPALDLLLCDSAFTACESANAAYKPAVAQNAAECIVELDDDVSCGAVQNCIFNALSSACFDMSANPLCADIVNACAGTGYELDHIDCHLVVDGLNELGREELHACVVEQDCAIGVGPCFEGLGVF